VKHNYYFLASSLADLFRGRTTGAGSLEEYLRFCETQVAPEDYDALMQLFLFNDIKNVVEHRADDDPFTTPSYYGREEIAMLTEEPERFLPFFRHIAANRIEEHRERPNLNEIDEAVSIFYDHLDDLDDTFVRDYYRAELDIRNISSAFELRAGEFEIQRYLIPLGEAYEKISANPDAEDFGLSAEFPWLRRYAALFGDVELTKREEALDEIRWQWLDERVGPRFFSLEFLCAYALKLASVERWLTLDEAKGEEMFNEILATVRRSVRFEIEFGDLDEEQKEERRREMERKRRKAEEEQAAGRQAAGRASENKESQ
jgi:Protein of unknown function (DUF2764)